MCWLCTGNGYKRFEELHMKSKLDTLVALSARRHGKLDCSVRSSIGCSFAGFRTTGLY